MRVKTLLLVIFLGLLSSPLRGQINRIVHLSYARGDSSVLCRIVSTRKVPFGSVYLPQSKHLVIFVRQSELSLSEPGPQPISGPVKSFYALQSENSRDVVEVHIQFREQRPYHIDYDGLDILVRISTSERGTVAKAPENTGNPSRLERVGPLSDPQRITMDYKEADLPNVLRLLARQNGVNIVAGPDVKGSVTISLRNVTLKEALDNILLANGYDYVIDGDVILVKSRETFLPGRATTKVYHLRYVDAYNLQDVIKNTISQNVKIQVLSPEFYGSSGTQSSRKAQPQRGVQPVQSGSQQKRKIRSSTLVVTGRPEIIAKIDDLVKQLDVPVPQILIESKLVELAPIKKSELGIDWDKTLSTTLLSQDVLPGGKAVDYSAINTNPMRSNSWQLGHLTASQFSAVLNFLREHTESKLISNPRILAMDNQMSTISVGTTVPVPQINRGLAGQGDIVTFNYKDVNIQLNVTPHVVNDNEIIMYVNPVIEEITGEVIIDVNRAPITSKRTVNTVVTVKDGETIVIGGMIKDDRKKVVSKVFLLGDIPLIGNLFQRTKIEQKQKDLIIFITPHIFRDNQ